MREKVYLIIGGTGVIGGHLVPELLKAGAGIRCLVRSNSNMVRLKGMMVDLMEGELRDADAMSAAMKGMDGVVHLASADPKEDPDFDETNILGMRNIVNAMEEHEVERIVFTSSSVAFSRENRGRYGESKLKEEKILKDSRLKYSILIPSQVYGEYYRKNVNSLLWLIKKSPIIPVLGKGEYRIQPVYIKDVVRAIVSVLANDTTVKKEYFIAGPEPLTFNQLVDVGSRVLGVKRFKLHVPITLARTLAVICGKISENASVNVGKIDRATQENVFDILPAKTDFGFAPIPIEEGMRLTVRSL